MKNNAAEVKSPYQPPQAKLIISHDRQDGATDIASSDLSPYPTQKVIGLYVLFGGLIGGLILGIGMLLTNIQKISYFMASWERTIKEFIIFSLISSVVGLLPAIITGVACSKLKIYFDSIAQVAKLFVVGFLSTLLLAIWFAFIDLFGDQLVVFLIVCGTGGLSAIITGAIALPKHR